MKTTKTIVSIAVAVLLIITSSLTAYATAPDYDSTKPFFQIESVSADAGDEIEIDISIGNNPGFWAARFSVACDDGLSIISEDDTPILNWATLQNAEYEASLSNNVLTCLINSENSSNITHNGVILTLKIKVSQSILAGSYNVYFTSYSSNNFINYEAQKVPFTFGDGVVMIENGALVYNAVDCSPTASAGTVSTYNQTDLKPNSTLSGFVPSATGDCITYTLSDVSAGTYTLYTNSRDYSGRGTYDVYVDDTLLSSVNYVDSLVMNIREIGIITITEQKDVTIKFVATKVGTLYLLNFELIRTNDEQPSDPTAYSITIDSIKVASVEQGKSYTLPNNNDNIVAYKDANGKYYACGEAIEIVESIDLTSVEFSMQTLEQASMRLNADETAKKISGIRFYTEIDQKLIDTLRNNNFTIELGTLITPKNYFTSKSTTDLKFGVDFGQNVNYVCVPFTSTNYYTTNSFSGIVGSIRNVKDNHALWNFVGRGYAKVTFNGIEKIVYADGKDSLPERSIAYIAYQLKIDSSAYEAYNEDQKAMIDYYYFFLKDPALEDIF